MLRSLTTPLPAPPPAGELRKVNLRYRCSICGTEMRMTLATDEDCPTRRGTARRTWTWWRRLE